MHYVIYKTTNLVNGKFYIGKHQTNDLNDGYIGSGKLLQRAIKKYGLDQFKTEILEICPTEDHMNLAEKIYVVVDREVSYNLCSGGKGGFGYINLNRLWDTEQRRLAAQLNIRKVNLLPRTKESQNKRTATFKENFKKGKFINFGKGFSNKKHTVESIQKMIENKKDHGLGPNNSQFGTCWMTNEINNIKIKKDKHVIEKYISLGYRLGRIIIR